MTPPKVTFVTASFHDFAWVRLQIRRIRETTPAAAIARFLVVDQDRTAASQARLAALDARVEVFQYERSEAHFTVAGHDHPAVLNRVMREVESEWCCLLDSDAHPMNGGWLGRCRELLEAYDALLAQDPRFPWVSHPCFMVLRQVDLGHLDFDEGFLATRYDTGRRVRRQLEQAGRRCFLAPYERTFQGRWGHVYLGSIYHHGKGSFEGGGEILRRQVTWRHRYFRNRVLGEGRYHLRPVETIGYVLRCRADYWKQRIQGRFLPRTGGKAIPRFDGPKAEAGAPGRDRVAA